MLHPATIPLHFQVQAAGRDRVFRGLLGALVIPAQVSMIPVFLLLKSAGLVNTYAGVLLPTMANVKHVIAQKHA